MMKSEPIGEMLVKEQMISPRQLQEAVGYQRQHGGTLGISLVSLGYVTDDAIMALLSRHYGVPSIDLSQLEIRADVARLISPKTARKHQVIPLRRMGTTLTVAMTDPTNVPALDDIKFMTGLTLESVVATETAVTKALDRYYANDAVDLSRNSLQIMARQLAEAPLDDAEVEVVEDVEELDVVALERQGGEAPVVRLVNTLLASAVRQGASDIHIEPYEQEFRVRFRIDGVLYNVMTPPLRVRDAMTSRLKVLAKLDIAEKRLPQDGRVKMRFRDAGLTREIALRVSCLPTLFGEKLVLRLLDRSQLVLDMTRLGFEEAALQRFEESIHRPWGMVLVTGPTGSGKTNTLYSGISRINGPDTNIMTAEDPVEFNLFGVNQVQIRESIGLTFATALRSFLRQDPNVILVGEIRDPETAEVAVKAALTGHLVLSTLHTNDAPGAVTRLANMGIDPFLVSNAVSLVCAQRLVRRVCRHCCESASVSPDFLRQYGLTSGSDRVQPVDARGCPKCRYTGYEGRIGLFEVMTLTDTLRDLILRRAPSATLRRRAIEEGMVTLYQSGLRQVAAGVTTLEEVMRETACR